MKQIDKLIDRAHSNIHPQFSGPVLVEKIQNGKYTVSYMIWLGSRKLGVVTDKDVVSSEDDIFPHLRNTIAKYSGGLGSV